MTGLSLGKTVDVHCYVQDGSGVSLSLATAVTYHPSIILG